MTQENLDGVCGVDAVLQGLRASLVNTTLASDRMTTEAASERDPVRRRSIFEEYYRNFESKPMADPLIYKSAILDAYGIYDDFAMSVIDTENYIVAQEIISSMENPIMVGAVLTTPQYGQPNGMLYWPGFSQYEWAKDIKWEEFEKRFIKRDNAGMSELTKVNPDMVSGPAIHSRLWFAYGTLREYYNPDLNPNFDRLFPGWRNASLVFDAMLLDRGSELTVDRISRRGRYINQIIPLMKNQDVKENIQQLIVDNPSIIPTDFNS